MSYLAKAVTKCNVPHLLSTSITSFHIMIPVVYATLPYEDWTAYQIKYRMPVIRLHCYQADEKPHEACQVPVYIRSNWSINLIDVVVDSL